jgi:hypothetical protein
MVGVPAASALLPLLSGEPSLRASLRASLPALASPRASLPAPASLPPRPGMPPLPGVIEPPEPPRPAAAPVAPPNVYVSDVPADPPGGGKVTIRVPPDPATPMVLPPSPGAPPTSPLFLAVRPERIPHAAGARRQANAPRTRKTRKRLRLHRWYVIMTAFSSLQRVAQACMRFNFLHGRRAGTYEGFTGASVPVENQALTSVDSSS